LLGGARRLVHIVVRIPVRHGGHLAQLCAAQPERVLLLLRLRVRHQDQRAIAPRVADEGEADAGIAGRAFDDEAAALDDRALLRVEHDVFRRAVLDRSAGVQELRLAEDRAAGELRRLAQLDQRRVAHGIDEVFADACRESRCVVSVTARHESPRHPVSSARSHHPKPGKSARSKRAPCRSRTYCTLRPPARSAPRRAPRSAMNAAVSRPTGHYDVAIVGGGHNGLTCAAYLARASLRVAVLERHSHVGGAAVTEEFHPGFRNSMASYTVSLLQRRIIDELDLAAHGLTIVPRPLANFVPAREGKGLAFHRETARTQASIAEHSARDAERYPRFTAELGRVTKLFRTLLLEAPVDPSGGWREHVRALARLPRLGALGPGGIATLWDLLAGSAGDWLDRWFDVEPLRGGLGFDAIVGHFASPYHPGSGYLLLHHSLGEVNGIEGAWGHAIGGMGAISAALEKAARAAGAEIFAECEAVHIDARADGCEIETPRGPVRARAVAAGLHPRILF